MAPPLRLSGPELGRFRDLLLAAFPRSRFEELLLFRLNQRLGDFASPADPDPTAFLNVLFKGANPQLWWRDLLVEARNANPRDPGLLEFAQDMGLAPGVVAVKDGVSTPITGSALQLQINSAQSTYDIVTWRRKVGEIESRVCRIEYPARRALGTGFLVGPDLVMTNYHVIEPFLARPELLPNLAVRFDYKVLEDGLTVNPGKAYSLAAAWLVDKAPYSVHDNEVPRLGEPAAGELDFALLRLSGQPGNDPVGGDTADPQPVARKWMVVKPTQHDFTANRAIYIVQHPDGKPMQIALDTNAVVDVATNGTRVRYTTTTEHGSSGSPCFSADWELVAIHHAGDPKYLAGLKPEYNQGVPIDAIWNWLKGQGRETELAS